MGFNLGFKGLIWVVLYKNSVTVHGVIFQMTKIWICGKHI